MQVVNSSALDNTGYAKKIFDPKEKIIELTQKLKEVMEESEARGKSLKSSREINKTLITMLYDNGVIKEGKSIFSLFRDVSLFYYTRKII